MAIDPICGMTVDEQSALSLIKDGKAHYFCSEHCRKKYAQDHGLPPQEAQGHCCSPTAKWYQSKTVVVAAALITLIGLSTILPILIPFRETFLMYVRTIWWATALGLFLGGLIDYYVPHEYISQVLAQPKKRTVFRAVLIGFLMSVCNHGILALAIQLYKKGAATSSIIAFLLASPWANLPLTLILVSFFGLIKALYIILAAIVIAITTGLIFQILEAKGLVERNEKTIKVEEFSIMEDMKRRWKTHPRNAHQIRQDLRGICQGMASLSDMILWWILIGAALASLAGAYVPAQLFHKYMGPSFGGMLVTLAIATIVEVCSEGSSPLAFEIYRQTGALGNALVFLMAGVATDYTEIGLIWTNIGWRAALWLPVVAVPQILVFGYLANLIF